MKQSSVSLPPVPKQKQTKIDSISLWNYGNSNTTRKWKILKTNRKLEKLIPKVQHKTTNRAQKISYKRRFAAANNPNYNKSSVTVIMAI
jgi:hypothetical protein